MISAMRVFTGTGILEAMTNKFVSPWVVVITLLRSGRLLRACLIKPIFGVSRCQGVS
jgi:hypothetical protein